MSVPARDVLKAAQLLRYDLVYVRQYVATWAPEVARDLWPDGQPSARERRAHDMLQGAESSFAVVRKEPTPPGKPDTKT